MTIAKNLITNPLALLTILFSLIVFGFSTSLVSAQAPTEQQRSVCQGSKLAFGSANPKECDFEQADPTNKVNNIIATIVNIISVIVGIVAVIMIIIGGFRFITSGGDSAKVTSARNTILYALIGLIVVVFAQFVVKFVLSKAIGTTN